MYVRTRGERPPNSIRTKLISFVLLLTLPLILMLIASTMYAIRVVRTQVAESYDYLLNAYIVQTDEHLEAISRTLDNLVALDANILTMERAPAEADTVYVLAKMQLLATLRDQAGRLNMTGSLFVYHETRNDYFETNNERNLTFAYRESIKNDIIGALRGEGGAVFPQRKWVSRVMEGQYHLLYVLKSGDLVLGARLPASSLTLPQELNRPDGAGGALYVTDEWRPMTETGQPDRDWKPPVEQYAAEGGVSGYLVLNKPSSQGDFRLLAFIPEDDILQNLPFLQRLYLVAFLASFAIIPVGLYYLRRTILVPLQRIVSTMKKVESGGLATRIKPYPTSLEFQIVNETFNRMISQIEDLKIHVYEEKLMKQREELHRLQLQINPHFFMNALNMLHHLAKSRRTKLAAELALCLIQHFRFLIRNGHSPFVLLRDELDHCRNYLRIQQLRYPGNMAYELDVPDYLQEVRVPPLSVQTFVENAIKHGLTLDEPIRISVKAEPVEYRSVPSIRITIEDNGPGFSADVLRTLREGGKLATEDGKHLGIWNVQRRLDLLYPDQHAIRFRNLESGGAGIELILPMYLMERGERGA